MTITLTYLGHLTLLTARMVSFDAYHVTFDNTTCQYSHISATGSTLAVTATVCEPIFVDHFGG